MFCFRVSPVNVAYLDKMALPEHVVCQERRVQMVLEETAVPL